MTQEKKKGPPKGFKQSAEHVAKRMASLESGGKRHIPPKREEPRVFSTRNCSFCDKEYTCKDQTADGVQKFCSPKCSHLNRAALNQLRRDALMAKDTKECTKCKTIFPRSEFYKSKSTFDGLNNICKVCALYNFIRSKYGLETDIYLKMLEEHEGKCRICQKPEDRLNIDHCHDTGLVRGLLCTKCNQGLGSFFDDPETLRRAADYLEASREPKEPS